jgi:hypothetical protein
MIYLFSSRVSQDAARKLKWGWLQGYTEEKLHPQATPGKMPQLPP